jgi:uncharacterized protein (TIGR02145 family)
MMQYSTTQGLLGICPTGWHLPTDTDWCTLTTFVDATVNCLANGWSGTDASGKMKETGTIHWLTPNTGATNSSGFTALPGGIRSYNGLFSDLTIGTNLWSSSEYDATYAWRQYLDYGSTLLYRGNNVRKSIGFSVRCLKDN